VQARRKEFFKVTITHQQTNKPTNQQTKKPKNQQINKPNKSWIKKRFTFVVSFVALGVWVVINKLD
jgi:hypothetical protein